MLFSQSYVVLLWMLGGHGNKTNGPFEGTKLPFGEKNKIVYFFAPKKKIVGRHVLFVSNVLSPSNAALKVKFNTYPEKSATSN